MRWPFKEIVDKGTKIINDLAEEVKKKASELAKDKLEIKHECIEKSTHFQNIFDEFTNYTTSQINRYWKMENDGLKELKANLTEMSKLNFDSLSLDALSDKFDLLGLSKTSGLLMVGIRDVPLFAYDCPQLLIPQPQKKFEAFKTVLNKKYYNDKLTNIIEAATGNAQVSAIKIDGTVTANNLKSKNPTDVGLIIAQFILELIIIEIKTIYTIYKDLTAEVAASAAAAAATGGAAIPLSTAVVLITLAKNLVVAALLITIAIIVMIIEIRLLPG